MKGESEHEGRAAVLAWRLYVVLKQVGARMGLSAGS